MVAVHVAVHVSPESVDGFREATLANARASLDEPGVLRFDVLQEEGDPTRFLLVEVYRETGDQALHRETGHYRIWRDAVAGMMAEPRSATRYLPLFPEEYGRQSGV